MIVTDAVSAYLDGLRPAPDPVLAEMEAHGAREGIPIVVPETGAFLSVLALASGARRIVEVGTAIGVSTLYLARALPPGGTVVSFEIDEARHARRATTSTAPACSNRRPASAGCPRRPGRRSTGPFDMAFIDGVKAQYGDYFERLLPLLGTGGVLAVDNVLMSGTVAEGRGDGDWTDEQIATARAFNERLLGDEQLVGTLTPVGDGVLIAVRR